MEIVIWQRADLCQEHGWSEPAGTSAPAQDEDVQAVLGMNPNSSK